MQIQVSGWLRVECQKGVSVTEHSVVVSPEHGSLDCENWKLNKQADVTQRAATFVLGISLTQGSLVDLRSGGRSVVS